jgi:hypothetical protein
MGLLRDRARDRRVLRVVRVELAKRLVQRRVEQRARVPLARVAKCPQTLAVGRRDRALEGELDVVRVNPTRICVRRGGGVTDSGLRVPAKALAVSPSARERRGCLDGYQGAAR